MWHSLPVPHSLQLSLSRFGSFSPLPCRFAMGKKRKSIASRLDEVDRGMYSTFCSAANSLSQLYTHAMNQQKLSFQAGERHALEKVYQWILRQCEEGAKVTTTDIVAYLQNEIEYGEDTSMSPRVQFQQHQQPQFPNAIVPTSPYIFSQLTGAQGPRAGNPDQAKNPVFSNALSSPVRRSLQHYQLVQRNGVQNPEASSIHQNRDAQPLSSNDTSMDMHSDSPARESY